MNLEWGKVIKSINWTFIFNLVNFAILLYLLKRLLFKPALAYLDRRRELIASRMEAARVGEEEAAELLEKRTQALQSAYEQSREIADRARIQADEYLQEKKGEAKQEARRIVDDARLQIEQERSEMERDLRRAYAEIAVMGASQVLGREVKLEDHQRFLDELLAGIDEDALKVER